MSKDGSSVDGVQAGALAVETDRLRFSFLRDGVDKADMKEKTASAQVSAIQIASINIEGLSTVKTYHDGGP